MRVGLLIGDQDRPARDGATFECQGPLAGSVATQAAAAGMEDALAAIEAAARAFPDWAAIAPTARRKMLNRAAELLDAHADEFVTRVVAETGAAPAWGRFNARLAAEMMREAAAMCTHIRGDVVSSDKKGCTSLVMRKPAGVCLGIAPWNGPVILAVRAIAMPLACGNTVVLKTSEHSPATQHLIGKIMQDAGIPSGVVNVISVAEKDNPAVIEAMIAHPAVRRINFTGSTRVGRIIGEMAGRHLKPVVLELGGKGPLIVLEDANIDAAVDAAIFGAFMHSGQICMSTERLIVVHAIADAFVRKFVERASQLRVGDPRESDVELASMLEISSTGRSRDLIEDAVSHGAALLTGGEVQGTFMSATVIDRVSPAMRLYAEESFGPIASVIRVGNAEEALRVANDSEYGLSGAIFTEDVTRALSMARRLNLGAVHINGPTVQDEAHVPFGGVRNSGYGRFAGEAGVHEFTDICWVTIEEHDQHYPI